MITTNSIETRRNDGELRTKFVENWKNNMEKYGQIVTIAYGSLNGENKQAPEQIKKIAI